MKQIRFNEPFLTGNELTYIQDVFEQKQFYGTGKYTRLCTDLICNRLNAAHVLLTDSCTSALEIIALLLRDRSQRQEVILPSYTFTSTGSAFARAGFDLVFAEIDPRTMMLDAEDARSRITEHTVAIITVHYGGYCSDVMSLKAVCKLNNLYFIEDAAQGFDAWFNGQALGTIGDFGAFSFHETKNIHAGLSGALVINADGFADRAQHIWERGTNRQEVLKGLVDKYSWVEIGGSFYPTELQAAFLYAQLEQLDQNKQQRKTIYETYLKLLEPLKRRKDVWFPDCQDQYESNYHAFWLQFRSEAECDQVRLQLVHHKIAAYIGYVPLHSSKVGRSMGYTAEALPLTEEYAKRILRLPFHNSLSEQDIQFVCATIRSCFDA